MVQTLTREHFQVCLNYDGNITDTSMKAVVAALSSVKVPKVEKVNIASVYRHGGQVYSPSTLSDDPISNPELTS